jgi:glucose-1-phosphate thymidylyltransferase
MHPIEVIGLIPCGGHARRISPLPCSKELFPVGFHKLPDGSERVKVASHSLLEKMRIGGVQKAFFILRKGKWDIPEYYGDGEAIGMNLGYLMMGRPDGTAYTLDQAYPFVRGKRVALGFPDILFGPSDAFKRAMVRLADTRADIVMGLYRVHDIRISDMLGIDRTGRVNEMQIKPEETKLKLGWVFAVWNPRFSEFLHEYLATPRTSTGTEPPGELTVGAVIQAGLHEKLRMQSVLFPRHTYLDIGTPDGMQRLAASPGTRGFLAKKQP